MSPFGRLDVRLAASFYRQRSGLSLADRVGLALARSLSSPAYTTDYLCQHWANDLGVDVQLIRRPPVVAGAGGDPVGEDWATPWPRSTRRPAARSGPEVPVPTPRC